MDDKKKMYGHAPENLEATLGRMVQESWAESNCSMDATYSKVKEKLDWDRRFDYFDKERLIQKVRESGSNGSRLDLSDPFLIGQPKRPLSR